ncbi:MAG: TonB family protein [Nannocystaceae bacterium]|nr:TonB family protein [Nannocystaceae bacterium]
MSSSLLRSLAAPTAMFIVATTMATVSATVISLSVVSYAAPQPVVEPETVCPSSHAVQLEVERVIVDAPESAAEPEPAPVAERRSSRPRPAASVTGVLDKHVIRRIVRAHIAEVRYCYNEGLSTQPELQGRVSVQFTIASSGTVEDASIASTTFDNAEVVECIAGAVKRWQFPRSEGESTVVTYPFVFNPD